MTWKFVSVPASRHSFDACGVAAWTVVEKDARPPRRPGRNAGDPKRDYRTLHRIADELAPVFAEKLRAGLDRFAGAVDLRSVLAAVVAGDRDRIVSSIPWDELVDRLNVEEEILAAAERAGVKTEEALRALVARTSPRAEFALDFDQRKANVERWARESSSQLITRVSEESKEAVREIVRRQFAEQRPVDETAQAIARTVGLNARQASALRNFNLDQVARGASDKTVERRTEAYRKRLVAQRGELIARTEMIASVNAGQLEAWRQAQRDGLVPKGRQTVKVWIVTPDDRLCPICEPLGDVTKPLDGEFRLSTGETVDGPPAHPNCRCALGLEFK